MQHDRATAETASTPTPSPSAGPYVVTSPLPIPVPTPAPDGWSKVRALALRQLDRFISLEPKVLCGKDPGAVHDLRVASRRLQQILDLLYPAPDRELRRLRRGIRRCRRVLSQARNYDVLLARVEKSLSVKRPAQREALETVRDYLYQRRSESHAEALRKLSKANAASLYVALQVYLGAPATESDAGPDGALEGGDGFEAFHVRLGKAMEGVWRDFETKAAESHRDERALALHAVRIAAKRLRYLTEVMREFDVPGSDQALVWLRKLQQRLGDWHDLEVMEQAMTEMLARPKFLRRRPDLAMGALRLMLRNRALKKSYQGKYLRMASDSGGYSRLKAWADHLLSSPAAAFGKA